MGERAAKACRYELRSRALYSESTHGCTAMDPKPRITITLPDGSEKEGDAFVTTPLDVAKQISEGLAQAVIISRVVYSRRYDEGDMVVACDKEEEETQPSSQLHQDDSGELWDLNRPLVGNCSMQLIKFEDPDGKMVCMRTRRRLHAPYVILRRSSGIPARIFWAQPLKTHTART
jgi:hypothetical protein